MVSLVVFNNRITFVFQPDDTTAMNGDTVLNACTMFVTFFTCIVQYRV